MPTICCTTPGAAPCTAIDTAIDTAIRTAIHTATRAARAHFLLGLLLVIAVPLSQSQTAAPTPADPPIAQPVQPPELAGSKFAVEGHTDARGSADYNQRLSQQRALAVRDLLKTRGVDEDRLVASGKGATTPVNTAEPFAPENRRVRIVNLD